MSNQHDTAVRAAKVLGCIRSCIFNLFGMDMGVCKLSKIQDLSYCSSCSTLHVMEKEASRAVPFWLSHIKAVRQPRTSQARTSGNVGAKMCEM